MSEIIASQIESAKNQIKAINGKELSDDRAFSHVLLKHFYDVDFVDQNDYITDGPNDGGIDFLYYDDEENKLSICQSKYTGSMSYEQIGNEFDKMHSTIQNFKRAHTGSYNEKVKRALQNALDRLPDDNSDNIEYYFFTTAEVNVTIAKRKLENTQHDFSIDAISIIPFDDIEKTIQRNLETISTVSYEKIKLDRPNNYLQYESNDLMGIFCSVHSSSIIQLYNKYSGAGLFDLNIRRYIRNKLVDSGITKTLDTDRDNFWFLNNGIIIACTEYDVDGDTIHLENFSIVNGGQTTQLIGTYKGSNTDEFLIPCKIVATKNDKNASYFYTKIAEATNSQKPIYPRDLKSNTPEMMNLKSCLGQENIYLEIKRGFKPNRKYNYSIKNDELGQLILSFALQQPGTARYGKAKIFESGTYERIFKVNYDKDPQKKAFLKDLVDLASRYSDIEKKFKTNENSGLDATQTEILKNGKQIIFAIMGMCYRLVNKDIQEFDLINSPASIATIPFNYGRFLSNYAEDDLEKKIENVIKDIVIIVADAYKLALSNKQTSSVSHFIKTDGRYYNDILPSLSRAFNFLSGQDLKANIDIFKR